MCLTGHLHHPVNAFHLNLAAGICSHSATTTLVRLGTNLVDKAEFRAVSLSNVLAIVV